MTIDSLEQYESTIKLLNLLHNLRVDGTNKAWSDFQDYHASDWATCNDCNELLMDCACFEEEHRHRYYAEYDDEASYD